MTVYYYCHFIMPVLLSSINESSVKKDVTNYYASKMLYNLESGWMNRFYWIKTGLKIIPFCFSNDVKPDHTQSLLWPTIWKNGFMRPNLFELVTRQKLNKEQFNAWKKYEPPRNLLAGRWVLWVDPAAAWNAIGDISTLVAFVCKTKALY